MATDIDKARQNLIAAMWVVVDILPAFGVKYDPDQPRDEQGRFASDGGGDGGGATNESGISFDLRKDADEWGFKQDGINPKLSQKQMEVIKDYKYGVTYKSINGYLRTGESEYDWSEEINTIDNTLANTSIPEDIVTFRGFPADIFPNEDMTDSIITDKGFLSTSLARETGEKYSRWSGEDGGGKGLLEINVPAGHPGIWMEEYWASGESEILLPRDTKLQVLSDRLRDDDVRIISVKVLP